MPRPRSASSHKKVLDAALALVSERGIEGASMDAIAEASGVSKATIYKHWKDKDALLLEMMADIAGLHSRPIFDSGNTRRDIFAVLTYKPKEEPELKDRIMPHLMAYSARNPSFGRAWRQMVMEPPRQELRHLLKLGIEKGELTSRLDVELSLALLLGPMIYWFVFQKGSCEEDESRRDERNSRRPEAARAGQFAGASRSDDGLRKLARGVVDAFWGAFASRQETKARHGSRS